MSKVMDLLIQASQLDEARAAKLSSFSIGFDIASAVAKAAKSVGLAPSNNADIPYTSLLILYSRHRGAPMLARLYGEVIQRHLRGAPTVLARYREDRAQMHNLKCWFRFEDEAWELAIDTKNDDR